MAAAVDYNGNPASTSSTGGWTSALFIIGKGVEMAERFAYYGITSNLISYLTGPLGESTAAGAANENTWSGAASSLALVGAFLADSWLGRYRTVLYSSFLAFLGLGMLTLSATLPSLKPPECTKIDSEIVSCPSPSTFQVGFFFFSLYLIALAHGGHKPCTQAFGADQFDTRDPAESASRSSFFNYWYFGVCTGTISAQLVLNYIQDNYGWALGFGIPFVAVGIALVAFLAGRKTYRYLPVATESPFVRIGQVCGASLKKRWRMHSTRFDDAKETLLPDESSQCGLLDHAEPHEISSQSNIKMSEEEVTSLARLFPLWSTCVVYAMVFAQPPTLFTKQGSTMERHIGSGFQIPAAALQSCISITTIAFLPIYDSFLVPFARKFTGRPSGLTMLQRIGTGILLSVLSTVLAALVEMRRLKVARDSGLVDRPDITVPMSIWWLAPQNILFGISDAFATVGLQEFFYDQVPDCLRSLGIALYLCIFGIGRFFSGFLISIIDRVTGGKENGWFANNLNKAHIDYFFWLLAGLGFASFVVYLRFAKSYVYKRKVR
ncbi:Protein NRT1/ PTR FAMILY 5.10 [Rhynchospora pubera]|uniref:Protein NRT1/ PTR FAMILY 5.10 n=1 Tax=Rhynchospora pubera TaxID=906938 RepID=A0AAV8FSW5_9POAL|nr:Protein NRT1/ PTR FAMILY 5.10 [Rhynchospora pubera]